MKLILLLYLLLLKENINYSEFLDPIYISEDLDKENNKLRDIIKEKTEG